MVLGSSESEFSGTFSGTRHVSLEGDPKSQNDGTAERRNGEMAENYLKSLNTERRKTTPNPKTQNGGK